MRSAPKLSVVVVFHNMPREAPRTLFTLSSAYQRGVKDHDYEVIVVDAGSKQPLTEDFVASFGENFRLLRTPSSSSPVKAVNQAAATASGEAIALCIDGARMLSPGVVRLMLAAFEIYPNPVVATRSWHLGPDLQNRSMLLGYDQNTEDELLKKIDWRSNGYDLFDIASLASSSSDGWFGPISESNCVAVTRSSWTMMGGLNPEFLSPGGGLVNLDFFRKACERLDELVILLGEGTFHQFHGGVCTNCPLDQHQWKAMHEEYRQIRTRDFAPPSKAPIYFGGMPHQALRFAHNFASHPSAQPTFGTCSGSADTRTSNTGDPADGLVIRTGG